ncbi:MAG TPA: GNAT family N-acetyltransferase [Arenicellales bacterium]|nr:GNAT family N-acetyltransferase [Arenicellales bacterium]
MITISVEDPGAPEVTELLREHLREMSSLTPPESVHALDVDALRRADVTFWTARQDGELLGCAALKELDGEHAEIKSMRTTGTHRRKGVARRLLETVLAEARRRGYRRVSLETGSQDAFEPARRLYAEYGFIDCAPFADYIDDPNSVYMTREL